MLSRITLTFIRLNRVLRAAGLSTSSLLKEVVIHDHTPRMTFGPEEPFVPSFPRKRDPVAHGAEARWMARHSSVEKRFPPSRE
jgi:hypothetical protein